MAWEEETEAYRLKKLSDGEETVKILMSIGVALGLVVLVTELVHLISLRY